jgi:hypothetical protein
MFSFISTIFKEQHIDSLRDLYKTIRRYGCILTQLESITNSSVESVITILHNNIIYQVTLIDGDVTDLYDFTNRIEYKEI